MLHGFPPCPSGSFALRGFRRARQAKPESRAATRTRFRADGPAPTLYGDFAEIKSESSFSRMRLALGKKREKLIGALIGRQAGTFVVHECEDESVVVLQTNRNRSSRRRVAHGVFQQIAEDAVNTRRIADNAPAARTASVRAQSQADLAFAKRRRKFLDRLLGAGEKVPSLGKLGFPSLLRGEVAGKSFEDPANHQILAL